MPYLLRRLRVKGQLHKHPFKKEILIENDYNLSLHGHDLISFHFSNVNNYHKKSNFLAWVNTINIFFGHGSFSFGAFERASLVFGGNYFGTKWSTFNDDDEFVRESYVHCIF